MKHKNRYLRGGYWPGKFPHPTTSPQNTSKRLGTPSQNSTKSEDFALEKLGLRLHTSMAPNEAQHHNNTNKTMVRAQKNISLGQKKAQLDNKNKSNARGKNIPAIRNVQMNTVDDKTTKVKSINVVTIPTGSTNLIEGLKSIERRVKGTPTAQDMTIECSERGNRSLCQHAGESIMDADTPPGSSIHKHCALEHHHPIILPIWAENQEEEGSSILNNLRQCNLELEEILENLKDLSPETFQKAIKRSCYWALSKNTYDLLSDPENNDGSQPTGDNTEAIQISQPHSNQGEKEDCHLYTPNPNETND
ncbi:hypothetical protein FXO38_30215 [Capsicum annuum]|nr:hypothetical protein FXO38_30215 [Capsicum annuum]KAF3643503.1 hypothetical protein FXO37_21947 [Capsicum annuum]